jgi:hypothetical protein
VFDRDVDMTIVMLEAPPVAQPEKHRSASPSAPRVQRRLPVGFPGLQPVPAPPAPVPAAAPASGKSTYRGTRLPLDSEF